MEEVKRFAFAVFPPTRLGNIVPRLRLYGGRVHWSALVALHGFREAEMSLRYLRLRMPRRHSDDCSPAVEQGLLNVSR